MDLYLSIVIPIYNEEESVRELITSLEDALRLFRKSYEIIFVHDGSTDRTFELLRIMEREHKHIRVFSFRKNLGKSPALMLGFKKALGEYIVTLDADLQDDPKNIKNLLQKLHKNELDLVTGWRRERRDHTFKILSSKLFNTIVSILFGLKIHDLNSGLKVYRSEVAKELQIYGGMHRFIPIIADEMGFRVGEKDVVHHPRKHGESKYKFTKIFTDIPDLITIYFLTKYTRRPLHFFGKIGSILFCVGFIILLYLTYIRLIFGESIGRRPLLLLGVLLVITGVQTIFTGLIADLIVNVNYKDEQSYPVKYESKD